MTKADLETTVDTESVIQREVDVIKSTYSSTQEIYKEVCVLLFFRHGVTPTANKLYAYVKKGSMTAPMEALGLFWKNLREKSKTQLDHPDLPEYLKQVAGEAISNIWRKAQEEADINLLALKEETGKIKEQCELTVAAKSQAITVIEKKLSESKKMYENSISANEALNAQVMQAGVTISSLSRQLEDAHLQIDAERKSLVVMEKTYREDVDKVRAQAIADNARLSAAEKRALLEIDKERTTCNKLHKEFEAHKKQYIAEIDKLSLELKKTQNHLAQQTVGNTALTTSIDAVNKELFSEKEKSTGYANDLKEAFEKRVQLESLCAVATARLLDQEKINTTLSENHRETLSKLEVMLRKVESLEEKNSALEKELKKGQS